MAAAISLVAALSAARLAAGPIDGLHLAALCQQLGRATA
jgi:hypothetical protein